MKISPPCVANQIASLPNSQSLGYANFTRSKIKHFHIGVKYKIDSYLLQPTQRNFDLKGGVTVKSVVKTIFHLYNSVSNVQKYCLDLWNKQVNSSEDDLREGFPCPMIIF